MITLVAGTMHAHAATKQFGPFSADPDHHAIKLSGEITRGSALDFRRAMMAAPDAKLMVLDSPGGLVDISLLIADDVNRAGMATLVPENANCMSACAFIFFAGKERQVDGKLGVHQISSDLGTIGGAQLAISDIIDLLNRFDTPTEVLTVMFRTPSDSLHVFTADEIATLHINRRAGAAEAPEAAKNTEPSSGHLPSTEPAKVAVGETTPSSDVTALAETKQLSAIEAYTRAPARLAVYIGLDFNGGDFRSLTTSGLLECAQACLKEEDRCKTFTFNASDEARRGPNCFLKDSRGLPDGNSVAISGRMLKLADADPDPLHLGVIDPKRDVVKDIDLTGGDLSKSPKRGVVTLELCRQACLKTKSCRAFSFVKAKRQCWLKSSMGSPTVRDGVTSGVKRSETFTPDKVISLR